MNRSMPGFPVHHQLPEFTQTHVHQVGDAIQPSHPLSSPPLPAPNPSQLSTSSQFGLALDFSWLKAIHGLTHCISAPVANSLRICIISQFNNLLVRI